MAAWNPDDQTLVLTKERLLQRRKEAIFRKLNDDYVAARENYAGRAFGASGGVAVNLFSGLATTAVESFGKQSMEDLLALLRDTCGDPPPPAALEWLRHEFQAHLDGLVVGLGAQLAADRRASGIGEKGAGYFAEQAALAAKRDLEVEIGKIELRSRLLHPPAPPAGVAATFDVFISHASEDKATVAIPLAEEFSRRGYRPWLDRLELRIGDRLMSKIDEGLRNSRYGVVILSHSFFRKNWTTWEMSALAALEATHLRKVILPVWHEVTKEEVAAFSPLLAAILGVRTDIGVPAIVDQIVRELGPPAAMDQRGGEARTD